METLDEFKRYLMRHYSTLPDVFDEIFDPKGSFHPSIAPVCDRINRISRNKFKICQKIANANFKKNGITFTVYSDKYGTEKIFPFDLVPRIIKNDDWKIIDKGLKQRITALNMFLHDIYHQQNILKTGIISKECFNWLSGFEEKVKNITPLGNIYIHVAGIDLVRDGSGKFLVLEDNLRTPSGVSYVLENRYIMKRLFPDIIEKSKIKPVDEYPLQLRKNLSSLTQHTDKPPTIVVLTPGSLNSAYFEHCFLAKKMGCELVKGQDLFVHNKKVYMKTTRGPLQVDIIYRRIDDEFLDPGIFREDSMLGVNGIMQAYKAGNVVIANAVGNGIADDKSLYPLVPAMIRFYLGEEPILDQIQTFQCNKSDELSYILANMENLVIKKTNGSGGYGMLIGATASCEEIETFKAIIKDKPNEYIAQPIVELSTCPTFDGKEFVARRVDLRPFVITGKEQWVLPGGLTRVALNEGSYIVNSSQGGGSKDTWIVE